MILFVCFGYNQNMKEDWDLLFVWLYPEPE